MFYPMTILHQKEMCLTMANEKLTIVTIVKDWRCGHQNDNDNDLKSLP